MLNDLVSKKTAGNDCTEKNCFTANLLILFKNSTTLVKNLTVINLIIFWFMPVVEAGTQPLRPRTQKKS